MPNTLFIISVDDILMSDNRPLHSVDRAVRIEVPHEVFAEVALRTDPDATRTEINDALHDHVIKITRVSRTRRLQRR
jgi:hypothetical protein